MGPGLSLVPTLVLFWLAFSIDSALAARAAFVFALINAPNLLPLIPLDGGVIVNALLRAVHIRLNRAIAWLGVASVSAIALYTQSVLVGIVFMFGVVQLVYESSFNTEAKCERLRGLQAVALIAAVLMTSAAYWTIAVRTYDPTVLRVALGEPHEVVHQRTPRSERTF
jgi:Zn-dependent protease